MFDDEVFDTYLDERQNHLSPQIAAGVVTVYAMAVAMQPLLKSQKQRRCKSS